MKNLIFFIGIVFILIGCSSKVNMIPEQALAMSSNEYSAIEQIIKSNPNWSKDLESETLRFNMFVQDTFNEIDNKKEYLKKIYNVQYYNFDGDGFNRDKSNKNIITVDKQADSTTFSNKPKDKIVETPIDNKVLSNSSNSLPLDKKEPLRKENKTYDSHIFNEYNF